MVNSLNVVVFFHLFDLTQAAERELERLQIRHGPAEPAFGDEHLAGGFGGFLDGFLGLLFGADENDFAALADDLVHELDRLFELFDGLAQVDDMDAVARFKNETAHLGIPTFGLVSEMNTCFQ